MPRSLQGKVAVVTGGASGIGRATALAFAREGASLIIADRHADGGQYTVRLITDNGGEATFVAVDVSQAAEVDAMIQTALATYGRVDYAHNNAGILPAQRAYIATYPEAVWDQVIATNLTGVWLCMKYEIPPMLQQGGGVIVNTASDVGL